MRKPDAESIQSRAWWEKPGLGIMYQIEARPGWQWERDWDKFNASMKNKNGNLNFNGPFCRMKDWVEFSKKAGVDYHIFEAKWHDGICYFDTKYTNWKTPVDYCRIFADESRRAGIPFMFYYSNVFDHNPQFDDIQPQRNSTASFITRHGRHIKEVRDFSLEFNRRVLSIKPRLSSDISLDDIQYNPKKYETYLLNQMTELVEQYRPDGMWMDWYMGKVERSAGLVMDYMKAKYPDVVLTFNLSNNSHLTKMHYTSGEAHTVRSAWDQGLKFRGRKRPWELVGPAALRWDDPTSRPDPNEGARIAAIIMASGGKYSFGLPAQMDGALYPVPAGQVAAVAEWYKPRRSLFTESIPMEYKGERVPGIEVSEIDFWTIGNIYGNDRIIHIFNFTGTNKSLLVRFAHSYWGNITNILLEPSGNEIELRNIPWTGYRYSSESTDVIIGMNDIDPVDTILRVKM